MTPVVRRTLGPLAVAAAILAWTTAPAAPLRPGGMVKPPAVMPAPAPAPAPLPGAKPIQPALPGIALPPQVSAAQPPSAAQGETAAVTLTLRGWLPGSPLGFGPGVSVVGIPIALSPTTLQVTVKVDPSAPPGFREVTMTVGGKPWAGPAKFEVRPAAHAVPSLRAPVAPVSPPVERKAPGVAVEAEPGFKVPGGALQPVRPGGKDAAEAGKAGTRKGAGGLLGGAMLFEPAAEGRAKLPGTGIRRANGIGTLVPNRWLAGKSYEVAFGGAAIDNTRDLSLGKDVKISGVKYLSPTSGKMTVSVDSDAASGPLRLRSRKAGSNEWEIEGAPAWVVSAVRRAAKPDLAAFAGKIAVQADEAIIEAALAKGVLDLSEPKWGKHKSGEFTVDSGLPILNDETVFRWFERNPGSADRFELRILKKDGTVVARKTVGKETFYRVEPSFVSAVLAGGTFGLENAPKAFQPQAGKVGGGPSLSGAAAGKAVKKGAAPFQGAFLPGLSKSGAAPGAVGGPLAKESLAGGIPGAVPPPPQPPAGTDFLWEVAGYRSYSQVEYAPGATPGEKGAKHVKETLVEVSISARWPLAKPKSPTGMACPSTRGSLTLQAFPTHKNEDGVADPNIYVKDHVVVSGTFTLDKAPWSVNAFTKYAPPGPGQTISTTAERYRFSNLFLDWGDGTDPVPVWGNSENGDAWAPSSPVRLVPYPENGWLYHAHPYKKPGSYTVRMYLLAEEDLGFLDALADGNAGGGGAQVGPGGKAVRSSSSGAASRAYMVYCNTLTIRAVEDLVATGPLELESVEIEAFSGSEASKGLPSASAAKAKAKASPGGRTASASARTKARKPATDKVAAKTKAATPAAAAGAVAKAGAELSPGALSALAGGEVAATVSACDAGLVAVARLGHFGRGRVRVAWFLDGKPFATEEREIEASPSRANLAPGQNDSDEGAIVGYAELRSPLIGVSIDAIGRHEVTVSAMVIPDARHMRFDRIAAVEAAPGALDAIGEAPAGGRKEAAPAKGGAARQVAVPKAGSPPAAWSAHLANAPKIGFLPESGAAVAGKAAIGWAPGTGTIGRAGSGRGGFSAVTGIGAQLAGAAGAAGAIGALLDKPTYVASEPLAYRVAASDPSKPCAFRFPTADGKHFVVSNLQNHVAKGADGRYNGYGTLMLQVTDGPSGAAVYPVTVPIQGWEVPDDLTVAKGAFDFQPNKPIEGLPGVKGAVKRLEGQAGEAVYATLDLAIADDTLRLPGVEKPHQWKGVRAPVTPTGDWIADKQALPKTLIGWSTFQVESTAVTIDLSREEGPAAGGSCAASGKGKGWVGVHLGPEATLYPYTLDLAKVATKAKDWAIIAGGMCGSASSGAFDHPIGDGSIHFDSIDVTVDKGYFNAVYKGLKVHVPWPDVTLTGGNAVVKSDKGKGTTLAFHFTTQKSPVENYGSVTMKAQNLAFDKTDLGWGLTADALFTFRDTDGKPFATVPANGLIFTMDRHAGLKKGASADVGLNQAGKLGGAPVDIQSVHLAFPASGDDRIRFAFATKASLSKSLPSADVSVLYALKVKQQLVAATGPKHDPFKVGLAFPPGNPSVTGDINPEIKESPGTGTAEWGDGIRLASLDPQVSGTATDAPIFLAGLLGSDGDTFAGTVDLGMMGSPIPGRADFRLGYKGNDDYWLFRTEVEIPGGVPILGPYVVLFRLRGGIGYNFPPAALTQGTITSAVPSMDGSIQFMAGARISETNQFIYSVDGNLVINLKQDPYMEINAWILESKPSSLSVPPFTGKVTIGKDGFLGTLHGGYSMLGGNVSLTIQESELWFGPGGFHVLLGTEQKPVLGHFFIADGTTYLMMGTDVGFQVGGNIHVNETVGNCGDLCAGVWADVGGKFALTLDPVHVKAEGSAGAGAKICALGECLSKGVSLAFRAEALPVSLSVGFGVGLPCPLPDVTVGIRVLPPLDFDIDADWCDFGLF
jgi:hypothetical protein